MRSVFSVFGIDINQVMSEVMSQGTSRGMDQGISAVNSSAGAEMSRLIELMPASGRMYCKIVSQPRQAAPIAIKLPRPGQEMRLIAINFEQWQQIAQPQRDLLLLQAVSWQTNLRWIKPEPYQILVAIGVAATLLQVWQANAAGIITLGGLTTVAATQIWRKTRSLEAEKIADEQAVAVAQRRGYSQSEAITALIGAIEALAQQQGRPLSLNETLRCQNLRALMT